MPMPLLGFDTDNDAVFMNETVRDYCQADDIAFTRCRPYRKNDQAWVEQKNGARVKKRYHPAATPFQRLLADTRVSAETKEQARAIHATLDPVALLREMRAAQQHLVEIADSTLPDGTKPTAPTLEQFLSGLRTAWKEGEVRPTARPHSKAIRLRRRPDPFAAVDGQLREWFATEPWRTSRELLERLQSECPGVYPDKLLRTLQRRVKAWRRTMAHRMNLRCFG
jgi:hypothetical protein